MAWGKRALVIVDYGIQGPVKTTPYLGSGSMHNLESFSNITNFKKLPRVNRYWLNSMGWDVFDGPKRLIRTLRDYQHAKATNIA